MTYNIYIMESNEFNEPYIANMDDEIRMRPGFVQRPMAETHEYYPKHDASGPFRWLVVGQSGSGKTNLVVESLLPHYVIKNGEFALDADGKPKIIKPKIIAQFYLLFVRDSEQEKYQELINYLDEVAENIRETIGDPDFQTYMLVNDPMEIPSVDDINRNIVNIAIFDDMILDNNDKIIEYFVRGRSRNINCIYLTQDYFSTESLIRRNCDYVTIFGVNNERDLIELAKNHSGGIPNKLFRKIFWEAIKPQYDGDHPFFHIDKKHYNKNFRFRRKFHEGFPWPTDLE